MKSFAICLLGLLGLVSVGSAAEPMVLGQVRQSNGLPVVAADVLLFDLADLRRGVVARATTDASGHFALRLASWGGRARPPGFTLGPNYPNPFNPSTVIPYHLPASGFVRLEVFNLLGQRIATLVDGARSAGSHAAVWDATDASGRSVGAGVYIYRLTAGAATATGRMVLVDGQAGVAAVGTAAGPPAVELAADSPVYGLAVSGAGLVAYVDADFRVGEDAVDIVLAAPRGMPLMKVSTDGGVLGDVDNNGQVDFFDMLLVALYSYNVSLVLPNNGNILLGDVNADGQVDLADAYVLATYLNNPSDSSLPSGIGQAVSPSGDDHGDFSGGVAGSPQTFSLPGGSSMDFVWIAPGVFQMGSPSSEVGRESDEGPVHEVEISKGFYMGTYEVTQGQWESVMGTTPWSGADYVREGSSYPAVGISWDDVHAFIGRLNDAAGDSLYRLPTEAEWEYACRAGTSTRWSFGDDASQLTDYAWYGDNAWSVGEQYSHAVGLKRPNPWGLYDMHGNVWELVQDWYNEDYYNSSPREDPPGPRGGSYRVLRGGGFNINAQAVRSAFRFGASPGNRNASLGVRLLGIGPAVRSSGDDHGDTRSDATRLSVGSSVAGQIETGGDVDYFQVQISESGELAVYTTGRLNTEGRLESSSGSSLATNDDGGRGNNFLINHSVGSGTYYLQVRGHSSSRTGSYTVHARFGGGGVAGSSQTFSLPGGSLMDFVWLAPGVFQMGSPDTEAGRESDEGPVHEVEISKGFYMGTYEVTQGEWESVMGTTPWSGLDYVREDSSHPAVYISWDDVHAFIGRLNDAAGDSLYRLPSEAEWEYACRAGTSTRWSFGDDASQLTDYAWYLGNAWDVGEAYGHRVGLKRANPWGLYDMHGNVGEWVQDWYDEDYYDSSPRVDPRGPRGGSIRVFRGGGFSASARLERSAYRSRRSPDFRRDYIGVRLLRIR